VFVRGLEVDALGLRRNQLSAQVEPLHLYIWHLVQGGNDIDVYGAEKVVLVFRLNCIG